MGKVFKNMAPYWKTLIIVFAVLVIQAFGDLALPTYTANIIDVGIQSSGIEHVVPEGITEKEYKYAELFMTDKEKSAWEDSYKKDGNIYKLNVTDKDKLDELDDQLSLPLILDYNMSAVNETQFKSYMAKFMGVDASVLKNMTVSQIGQQIGMKIETFTKEEENASGDKEKVTCVDMRAIFEAMAQSGKMTQESLLSVRTSAKKMIDTMGDTIVHSTGVEFALQSDKEAGVNVSHIQTVYLWHTGLKMAGIAGIIILCAITVSFFASRIGAGIGQTLRGKIYQKVMRFSNAEMDKFSTASLITRSTNDVQQVQLVSTLMLRLVAYAPVLGIGGILKVVQTKTEMGWVIIVAIVALLAFIGILMSFAMPKFKIMQSKIDSVNLVSREILTGLPVIRAFRREEREEERFDEVNRDLTRTTLFTNRVMTLMMPGMMFIMYGLTLGIVWVASHKINAGVMQVGSMTAFITYAMLIVMSFLLLTMLSIMLPRAGVAADRIDEIIKTDISIKETDVPKHLPECKGVVAFENVSFSYPGSPEPAVSGINFTALPNKVTAIIGSTGSGKSTIINLIPRLYDVTEGRVTIDGMDIRELPLKELRSQIGLVPQKGILFSGTIESNISFGKPDATQDEVEHAAEIAQAKDFIEEKNEKYESPISQGGTNVSGGQKQRLSIARAIAKNPRIFIFDDSFSALDMKTESALRKELKEKVKDSTVIIVAQRISTILHADQIIVLEEGRMAGIGTHEELLRDSEVYRQIAMSQLSEKELGIEAEESGEVKAHE